MDIEKQTSSYVTEHIKVFEKFPVREIEKIVEVLLEAYQQGKTVYTMGNGGHAATAAHLVADMAKHTVVSDKKDEVVIDKRFKIMCLNNDVATLTSWANDVSYDDVFSEQLKNWVGAGDVVIGISGSGNSENVLRALRVARQKGATTIGLSGYNGGKIKDIADICFIVPSDNISFIEDMHLSATHIWCNIIRMHIQGRL